MPCSLHPKIPSRCIIHFTHTNSVARRFTFFLVGLFSDFICLALISVRSLWLRAELRLLSSEHLNALIHRIKNEERKKRMRNGTATGNVLNSTTRKTFAGKCQKNAIKKFILKRHIIITCTELPDDAVFGAEDEIWKSDMDQTSLTSHRYEADKAIIQKFSFENCIDHWGTSRLELRISSCIWAC